MVNGPGYLLGMVTLYGKFVSSMTQHEMTLGRAKYNRKCCAGMMNLMVESRIRLVNTWTSQQIESEEGFADIQNAGGSTLAPFLALWYQKFPRVSAAVPLLVLQYHFSAGLETRLPECTISSSELRFASFSLRYDRIGSILMV
ncbi:hypothetical protein TorRG33x02_190730 [Trema orientale]|uniref:Uncharacterized protein n=1 Tax=Trema orientale TaxID=63057 RepID=A0A2P5EHV5_TREOI|nr:hypothetical protein TorRG33x02_190730 [Trema orientale]